MTMSNSITHMLNFLINEKTQTKILNYIIFNIIYFIYFIIGILFIIFSNNSLYIRIHNTVQIFFPNIYIIDDLNHPTLLGQIINANIFIILLLVLNTNIDYFNFDKKKKKAKK